MWRIHQFSKQKKFYITRFLLFFNSFFKKRSSIADVFRQLEKETNPQTREILRSKFRNYLERYWWLIVYNYYLNVQGPNGEKFSSWMKNNWRLKHMLKKF